MSKQKSHIDPALAQAVRTVVTDAEPGSWVYSKDVTQKILQAGYPAQPRSRAVVGMLLSALSGEGLLVHVPQPQARAEGCPAVTGSVYRRTPAPQACTCHPSIRTPKPGPVHDTTCPLYREPVHSAAVQAVLDEALDLSKIAAAVGPVTLDKLVIGVTYMPGDWKYEPKTLHVDFAAREVPQPHPDTVREVHQLLDRACGDAVSLTVYILK